MPARKRPSRLAANPDWVKAQLATIKRARGRGDLEREERLTLLHAFFSIVEEAQRDGKAARAQQRTARLLGRGTDSVSRVVRDWTEAAAAEAAAPATAALQSVDKGVLEDKLEKEESASKEVRVPRAPAVFCEVRDFVRRQVSQGKSATPKDVLGHLMYMRMMPVAAASTETMSKKDFQSCLRAVESYLPRAGFRRCRRRGGAASNAFGLLDPERLAARDAYLRAFMANRRLPAGQRRMEVYVDDSCTTHGGGQRLHVVAAIHGPGKHGGAGLVPNALCYARKAFDAKSFLAWWKDRLLPNLHEPCLITMDSAAHHSAKRAANTADPRRMKKAQLLAELSRIGAEPLPGISRMEALVQLRRWTDANVQPDAVKLAEQRGHRVLFTPPCFPDLQPAALLWAHMKTTTVADDPQAATASGLKRCLDAQFAQLLTPDGSKAIQRIIQAVDPRLALHAHNMEADDRDDGLPPATSTDDADADLQENAAETNQAVTEAPSSKP